MTPSEQLHLIYQIVLDQLWPSHKYLSCDPLNTWTKDRGEYWVAAHLQASQRILAEARGERERA